MKKEELRMKIDEIIQIKAPATIANIVCGFDVLGMAINEPYDEVSIKVTGNPGIIIRHKDDYGLPEDPDKNVAGVSLKALINQLKEPVGFEVEIKKNIMPGSGLGSSAASAMGVVAAANYLVGNKFSDQDLIRFAMEGEKLASGIAHADNIAPCLYGGITMINTAHSLDIHSISHPPLWCTVIHPQIEVKTADSRKIIRKEIPVKAAIQQWSNIAGLITGFFKSDYQLISQSLEDVIFEPVRSILIPGFNEVKKRSKEAGALGGGISGSGPSIFMLSENEIVAKRVEVAMKEVYDRIGLDFKIYVTTIKTSRIV